MPFRLDGMELRLIKFNLVHVRQNSFCLGFIQYLHLNRSFCVNCFDKTKVGK